MNSEKPAAPPSESENDGSDDGANKPPSTALNLDDQNIKRGIPVKATIEKRLEYGYQVSLKDYGSAMAFMPSTLRRNVGEIVLTIYVGREEETHQVRSLSSGDNDLRLPLKYQQ